MADSAAPNDLFKPLSITWLSPPLPAGVYGVRVLLSGADPDFEGGSCIHITACFGSASTEGQGRMVIIELPGCNAGS